MDQQKTLLDPDLWSYRSTGQDPKDCCYVYIWQPEMFQDRKATYSTSYAGMRIEFYFNADPVFYFNADPDQNFHFNANPNPAPRQSDANIRPLVYRPSRVPFWTFKPPFVSVHGSILSLQSSLIFILIRIRIQLPKNNADPCRSGSANPPFC